MRRRTVQPIVCFGAWTPSHGPFDRGKTKSANFTKNGNCFEECNVLGMESVSSAPFKKGETKMQIDW